MARGTWLDLIQSVVDYVLEQIVRAAAAVTGHRSLLMPPHQQA